MPHEPHPEDGKHRPVDRPNHSTTPGDVAEDEAQHLDPRIHVVDLASAERGINHGRWLYANQPARELDADIAAMLDSSPTAGATDWGVDDTADFAELDLSAITDTTLISQLAHGLALHGPAFAAWARHVNNDRKQLARFEHAYIGSYATPETWARSLADDLGWHDALDQAVTDPLLRLYVVLDYAAIADDSHQHWHLAAGSDDMVHVFAKESQRP
jgi:antirestriction protein